jgi:hypothetical protein
MWLDFNDSCPLYFLHEDFCIAGDFPEIISLDDQERLHSDNGPAVRWRDGFALDLQYYLLWLRP